MAVAIGGAALVGAGASMYAADKQGKAAGQAGQMTLDQYNRSRMDLAPYRSTGSAANTKLASYLGIGSQVDEQSPEFQQIYGALRAKFDADHIAKYGIGIDDPSANQPGVERTLEGFKQQASQQILQSNPSAASGDFGSLLKPYTGESLTSDPGYEFGLSEGEKGINRGALARGGFNSGATMKALLKYNQDYAGTKFNEGFNRDATTKNQTYSFLSGQSGQGENAAGMTAGLGANATGAAGNYLTQGADAGASGVVGATNSLTNGVGSYLQYQNNQSMMEYLKTLRGGMANTGASAPFGARG